MSDHASTGRPRPELLQPLDAVFGAVHVDEAISNMPPNPAVRLEAVVTLIYTLETGLLFHGTSAPAESLIARGIVPKAQPGADDWLMLRNGHNTMMRDDHVGAFATADPVVAASFASISSDLTGLPPLLVTLRIPDHVTPGSLCIDPCAPGCIFAPDGFPPDWIVDISVIPPEATVPAEYVCQNLPGPRPT